MQRILLVDDEENVLKALRRLLKTEAYEVETYVDPTAALTRAREVEFDLVISDYRMPQMDGVVFLKQFRQLQPDTMRLILSAYTDLSALLGAINDAQISRFISKPWNDKELLITISQVLQYRELLLENQRLADQVRAQKGIISRQEMMLREMARKHPALFHVERDEDGAIILNEEDLDR
ncbi:MAG: hypothetical protein Kow006_02150 [Gammaproteobacteria bacterium]